MPLLGSIRFPKLKPMVRGFEGSPYKARRYKSPLSAPVHFIRHSPELNHRHSVTLIHRHFKGFCVRIIIPFSRCEFQIVSIIVVRYPLRELGMGALCCTGKSVGTYVTCPNRDIPGLDG